MTEKKFKELTAWERRDGKKAVVLKVRDNGNIHVAHVDYARCAVHHPDGKENSNRDSNSDLIRPWREKRRGWVNVYEDSKDGVIFFGCDIYETKEGANIAVGEFDDAKRIDCFEWIEPTRGEQDED